MFTKVNPYKKGRWYRLFIESDGVDIKLTDVPSFFIEENGQIVTNDRRFHIVDVVYDYHTPAPNDSTSLDNDLVVMDDGRQGFAYLQAQSFDYAYIYVFGYFER